MPGNVLPVEYSVELEIPGWAKGQEGPLRLDRAALDALLLEPERYGRTLGEAVCAEPALRALYRELLAALRDQRIWLDIRPDELQAVRWERLVPPAESETSALGSVARSPCSRYIRVDDWSPTPPPVERPLRLLVVAAAPKDLDRWNLDPIHPAELAALHTLFD